MKTKLLILVLLSVCLNSFAGDGSLRRFANPVRDRYIVVLRSDIDAHAVPQIAKRLSAEHGGKLRLAMNNSINMFSVEMTERQAIAISHHPLVDWVEEVGLVYTSSLQTLPPPTMQWMNLWNLDRVDQYATQGSGTYQFCEKAADVIAYMVDTGVKGDHQEFVDPSTGQSRVKEGARWAQDGGFGNEICPSNGGTTAGLSMDTKLFVSHGTATASVLGGKNVGVAKGVTIVPLRIASCDPYWLQGAVSNTERLCWALDWIRSAANTDRFHRPALISLSTYAQPTDGLITALEAVINRLVLDGTTFDGQPWSGIPVIASANNHARSDNNTSPARLAYRNRPTIAFPGFASQARVISVGGSGTRVVNGVLRDVKWQCPMYQGEPCWSENYAGITVPEYGSNHGNSVDIYAPAHNVETAYTDSTSAYRADRSPWNVPYQARSGTSFAAPFVAGIAARILQKEPSLSPGDVWQRIQQLAFSTPIPLDTSGCASGHYDVSGNPICDLSTSNSLLVMWRYYSATCSVEYP